MPNTIHEEILIRVEITMYDDHRYGDELHNGVHVDVNRSTDLFHYGYSHFLAILVSIVWKTVLFFSSTDAHSMSLVRWY